MDPYEEALEGLADAAAAVEALEAAVRGPGAHYTRAGDSDALRGLLAQSAIQSVLDAYRASLAKLSAEKRRREAAGQMAFQNGSRTLQRMA